jgi:septal ring factor EnvC (AmiA/AmiB activator)
MLKELAQKKEALEQQQKQLKIELSKLEEEINSIIEDIVCQQRKLTGKDTGVISFLQDGVKVKHDLPKRVKWDDSKLAEIAEKIKSFGDNPADYIDTKYSVSEKKYSSFPQPIQEVFLPARTLEFGKPKISLEIEY